VPHPKLTRYYEKIQHYKDLPDILVERIVHFFEHYKDLEPDKWVKIEGLYGPERAHELIRESAGRAETHG
jgi:inorganic pyrophosphatase